MTYLESITLVRTIPCLAEPGKIIVIGKPIERFEEVLPYLATLPGVIAYNPDQCTLTFRRQPGFLTIQRDQMYITQVKDVQEGLELLAALTESINTVWEHRQELVAVTIFEAYAQPARRLVAPAPDQLQAVWRADLHGICRWLAPAKSDAG